MAMLARVALENTCFPNTSIAVAKSLKSSQIGSSKLTGFSHAAEGRKTPV